MILEKILIQKIFPASIHWLMWIDFQLESTDVSIIRSLLRPLCSQTLHDLAIVAHLLHSTHRDSQSDIHRVKSHQKLTEGELQKEEASFLGSLPDYMLVSSAIFYDFIRAKSVSADTPFCWKLCSGFCLLCLLAPFVGC